MTNEELQEQIEQLKVGLMSLDGALRQVKENFESLAGRMARTVNRLTNRIEEVNDCVKSSRIRPERPYRQCNSRVTDLNYDRI